MSGPKQAKAPTLKVIQGGAAKPPPPKVATPSGAIPLLQLRELATASPRLTRELGLVMAQAASVLLEIMQHNSPVPLKATVEKKPRDYAVAPLIVTEAMRASHADIGEATHYGAYGVAILLARDIPSHTVRRCPGSPRTARARCIGG